VRDAIGSGAGLERLRRIIESQGGDPRVLDDYSRLPHVESREMVTAPRDGFLTRVDAELVGKASVILGAGRDRVEDAVDFAVGLLVLAKPGAAVRAGDPVFEVHYRDRDRLERARPLLNQAMEFGTAPPAPARLILDEVH
ncbi:MAG TPA: hypothetical protein VGH34_19705, partial [Vicinamibacterales bacterium]